LGLAISKKLINMMGGDVGLKSQPGVGSEFFFNVNLGISENIEKKERKSIQTLHSMNALIVDDNEIACEVLETYIQNFFGSIQVVHSGEKALNLINDDLRKNKNFDFIFMDWKMPGLNGLETSEQIMLNSKIKGAKQPHIIMVSNLSSEACMKQAENKHIDAYLIKPITQSLLLDTVMNILGSNSEIDDSSLKKQKAESEELPSFGGKLVLIVEDNTINQEVAIGLLEEFDIHADVADNGKIAIDIIEKQGENYYEAILMDLQMPEMDGYTATKHIRNKLNFKRIPIIATSADAMAGVKEKCIQIGMTDYVTKPINPKELHHTLSKYILHDSKSSSRQTQKNAKSEKSLIPKIQGLNISTALERVGGNEKTLMNILKKYMINYSNIDKSILKSVLNNDFATAEKIVHTIKGVTGNISADVLFEKSVSLDNLLKKTLQIEKNKIPNSLILEIKDSIKAFEVENNKLIQDLQKTQIFDSDPKKQTNIQISQQELNEKLSKLMQLLEECDSEAATLLEELMESIEATELDEISNLISNYEYDDALELLCDFSKKNIENSED